MNKFGWLLGKILAETCLKWIILVVNPSITKRWGPHSQTPVQVK